MINPEVGSIDDKYVHSDCGGQIKVISYVTIIYADVPKYVCLKCKDEFDSSDYEEFKEIQ